MWTEKLCEVFHFTWNASNRNPNIDDPPALNLSPFLCTVKFRQMHEDQPPQCIVCCCNLRQLKRNVKILMNIHISSAPHSPRRQKLNLRMKSLSLDSPESTEHAQRRKHHGAAATSDPHSNQSSSSRIQCRQSTHKICLDVVLYFLLSSHLSV